MFGMAMSEHMHETDRECNSGSSHKAVGVLLAMALCFAMFFCEIAESMQSCIATESVLELCVLLGIAVADVVAVLSVLRFCRIVRIG